MVGVRSAADVGSDDDSAVYFRGQLVSTPRAPSPAAPLSLAALGNARRVLRIRKEPVQEQNDGPSLHRLTLLNTKLNSSYQTVDIELELERRPGARPPSPLLSFSKKVASNGHPVRSWDEVMETNSTTIKWGRTDLVEQRGNREPMDDEVIIPIKPCLKPSEQAADHEEPLTRKRLVVKKIVYDDDEEAALMDAQTLVEKASESIVRKHFNSRRQTTNLKGKPPKRKQ